MKLRNTILAIAVVAVAGINVHIANDMQEQKKNLSLMSLENIAEGLEWSDIAEFFSNVANEVGEWWDNTKWICQEAVCYYELSGQPINGTRMAMNQDGGHPICTCGLMELSQYSNYF